MTDDLERLKFAQWVMERHLAWIAAAEVKTGVAVAIDTGMLGALATAFSSLQPGDRTAWATLMTVAAGVCLFVAVLCAATALLPRTNGPKSSHIFFGGIIKNEATEYDQKFRASALPDMLSDCLAQIHRNAEIARDKFKWVRKSMMWSFIAVLPWTAALALLIKR